MKESDGTQTFCAFTAVSYNTTCFYDSRSVYPSGNYQRNTFKLWAVEAPRTAEVNEILQVAPFYCNWHLDGISAIRVQTLGVLDVRVGYTFPTITTTTATDAVTLLYNSNSHKTKTTTPPRHRRQARQSPKTINTRKSSFVSHHAITSNHQSPPSAKSLVSTCLVSQKNVPGILLV